MEACVIGTRKRMPVLSCTKTRAWSGLVVEGVMRDHEVASLDGGECRPGSELAIFCNHCKLLDFLAIEMIVLRRPEHQKLSPHSYRWIASKSEHRRISENEFHFQPCFEHSK